MGDTFEYTKKTGVCRVHYNTEPESNFRQSPPILARLRAFNIFCGVLHG